MKAKRLMINGRIFEIGGKHMEFWEAIESLYGYSPERDYHCLECGHQVKHNWAIRRHIDHKHSGILLKLSGQAHGWNDAQDGWK